MEVQNVKSAAAIYAWNHSATVVNQRKSSRNYDLAEHLDRSNLPAERKNELLMQLTGKRKTMLQGAVFMLNQAPIKFDSLERALTLLNNANNSYQLGAVEAALQTQINTVCDLNTPDLTPENKTLCLYTLQNMIFALSDYNLKNDKENDYMPKILQDQYQMMLKGSTLGLDMDRLNKSTYSTQYHDDQNPTLAQWEFLDDQAIKQNMENITRYQLGRDDAILDNLRDTSVEETTQKTENSIVNYGTVTVEPAEEQKIKKFISMGLDKFNTKNLKDPNNLKELYNFAKNSVVDSKSDEYTVNYPIVNELAFAMVHRIAETGSTLQSQTIMKQNQGEERSL